MSARDKWFLCSDGFGCWYPDDCKTHCLLLGEDRHHMWCFSRRGGSCDCVSLNAGIRPPTGRPVQRIPPMKPRHPIHAWAIRCVRRLLRLLGDE